MDDQTFARQLCCWLDPFRLASLCQQYMENPGSLERRVDATREANSFTRASDVGLDRLLRIFLENFELSDEFLLLLPGVSRMPLGEAALRRMSGLRFTGEAAFENFDPSVSNNTVVTFAGPALEILAVAGPANFLFRFAPAFARSTSRHSTLSFRYMSRRAWRGLLGSALTLLGPAAARARMFIHLPA